MLPELTMTKTIHGKARGHMIELDEDLGVADGQDVEVTVRTVSSPQKPGDGLLRTEGALVDDPEWDDIMADIHQARKLDRRSEAQPLVEPFDLTAPHRWKQHRLLQGRQS